MVVTPSLGYGGAEKVAVKLSNYFVLKGYCVSLVSIHPIHCLKNSLSNKINFVQLETKHTK